MTGPIAGTILLAGSHEAVGVLIGGPAARARALACWSPGARVHAIDDRILVLFPTPRRLRAELAPGALVVAHRGQLCAVDPAGIEGLEPGALLCAHHGVIEARALGPELDPSAWLELDRVERVEATPLGPPPTAAAPPLEKIASDARAAIGDAIPAADHAALAAARALWGERPGDAGALPPGAPSALARAVAAIRGWLTGARAPGPSGAALATRGPSLLARALAALRAMVSAPARASSDGSAIQPTPPPGPSALDRLRGWLASIALRTRLSRLVTRRQAEYLARMLELFDRGDVREALRWAIPLAGTGTGELRPAFGVPQPRDDLSLSLARAGSGTAIGLAPDFYAFLRARYTAVLATLQADDRIDEAAFVLAELLGDAAGAVALLERHGRHAQAARLAEARELDPAIVVRQWILAREVGRALAIARKHGVFESAIAALRRTHPEPARELALAWAELLAAGGDPAAAVDALAGVAVADDRVASWVERALAIGGVPGARMLARRAVLAPGSYEDTRERVLALLEDDDDDGAAARAAFARELALQPTVPPVRTLARPAIRALLRDGTRSPDPTPLDLVATLERLADDAALRADRPGIAKMFAPAVLGSGSEPRVLRVEASDRGSIAVRDAAVLPGGRLVVALGEAGVRVLARDGRTVAAFDAPADALVVSDAGTRAIAVARRGGMMRLARIDLAERRAQTWWEADLGAFARTFDGGRWLVAERGTATFVDVLAPDWRALWTLPGEPCAHVERGRSLVALAARDREGALETWRFEERGMVLRSRTPLPPAMRAVDLAALALVPERWALGTVRASGSAQLARLDSWRTETLEGAPLPRGLALHPRFVCVATRTEPGVRVDVLDANGSGPKLHVLLDGASDAALRADDATLAIADDRGRVLAVDLRTGAVVRDLRVRA